MSRFVKIINLTFNTLYSVLSLLFAFSLSWLIVAKSEYFYPIWHDIGGLEENIEEYGPLNRFRSGFELTDREQRYELFNQIAHAVHHGGDGLEDIRYTTPNNPQGETLLHEDELIHLNDVTRVIKLATHTLVVSGLLWILITGWIIKHRKPFPRFRAQLAGFSALMLLLFLPVLFFGFEATFYQLHVWVFPDDHPWFFYYEDSLMSTMMEAPVLFMYISAVLAVFTVAFFVFMLMGEREYNRKL